MPELPEAETIVRRLRRHLPRRRIASLWIGRSDILRGDWPAGARSLAGRLIRGVEREGKRVCLLLSGGARLVFALGMTGRVTVGHPREAVSVHTHLRLRLDGGDLELRFQDARRFGRVWLTNGRSPPAGPAPRKLGPDAMTLTWHSFAGLLACRRQIKALLLDQQRLAGLGNIYADEALFRGRVHPRTRAASLSGQEGKRLLRSIRQVLRQAVAAGGSTVRDYRDADGQPGWFQVRHQVYGRAGKPCRRCGAVLRRILVAGRGTTVCPRCQKQR